MPFCPNGLPGQRRNRNARGLAAVEHSLDLAVAPHAIGKTGPAGALARAEHRPHQGKNAGGLDQQPGCPIRQMLPVAFSQACVEIIAHQRDGQIGRALARRERRAGSARRQAPLHPARRSIECGRGRPGDFPARPAATGRGLPSRRPTAPVEEVRPAGYSRGRAAASGLRGSCPSENSAPVPRTSSPMRPAAFTDCGRQRTIKLAVQEELAVLGIEAHRIGRQQIDGEIRRELRNVFAVECRAFP